MTSMLFDSSNEIFLTAASFINQTNKHLFLTGKAGTGKTTFLKYIRENSFKKMAVVAPTGVAAINAGGVTIHSLFQIPPGTYLPTEHSGFDSFDGKINNANSLFKNMRMNSSKRDLLRELDLLIIDEVSMVRCDLLDAIDAVLRHFRRQPMLPFGGVQVLYIGDLFQLPPVVPNYEWNLLKEFYRSPFFFDALVMQHTDPVYIELKKIYRQNDDIFISLLNNIRNNCCSPSDLQCLHQYFDPSFTPGNGEHYITLTTHNEKADVINHHELKKLPGKLYEFKAEVTGEFPERSFPADEILRLKEGAQIMFIKNDSGESRQYFNGKLGIIDSITDDSVFVKFDNETEKLELKKETWQNIRYRYHKEKDEIEEEELGSFSQYPIRLAWAITIHKSQGLTFEKAIIDAGESFSAGQVYVALSRLTSLEGLVLKSRIHANCIQTNETVIEFSRKEKDVNSLGETLKLEQEVFVKHTIVQGFNWQKILDVFQQHLESYEDRFLPDMEFCRKWAEDMVIQVRQIKETGSKFQKHLEKIFDENMDGGYQQLHERAVAASNYFIKETDEKLIASIRDHILYVTSQKRVKAYLSELTSLKQQLERRKQQLKNLVEITAALDQSPGSEKVLEAVGYFHKPLVAVVRDDGMMVKKKKQKGETQRLSLEMFKQGKTIIEIAKERNLVYSTIEGHLAGFIPTGEVDVHDIVDAVKLERIVEFLEQEPTLPSSAIKQQLGDEFSYGQIKAAMMWRETMKENLRS